MESISLNGSEHPCLRQRRLPLRVNNVVCRLNLPERTVRYLAQTGRLHAFKIDGKSWGFWPEDVQEYKGTMEADDAEVCQRQPPVWPAAPSGLGHQE
jgi:hypothetical protein